MSTKIIELLTTDNEVFTSYMFWSGILVVKIFFVTALTGLQRFTQHTFANPEDVIYKHAKVKYDDPNVERVRRAHLNDLENILPFFSIGFLYVLTNPSAYLAINLFRVVGIARIIHTLVYAVVVVPQPARFLAFIAALIPTLYMAFRVICFAF